MTDQPIIRLARGPQELRLADGLTRLEDTDRVEPYGTYTVQFEAVAGQALVVTVSADQIVELCVAEGFDTGSGRILAARRVEPGNGPYDFDLTITQTGCHVIEIKNAQAQWLNVQLLMHCPALLAMKEKKGPGNEDSSAISAAASANRLGNRRPKNRDRDGQ